MKKIKIPPRPLFLLLTGIICMLTACRKPEPTTYYKTIGIGYAYDVTNNRPLKGVIIRMRTNYEWMWASSLDDTLVTDNNGYYQVRFMEKIGYDGTGYPLYYTVTPITGYSFDVIDFGPMILPPHSDWEVIWKYNYYSCSILPSEFEGKNIFVLDTIKFIKVINN